MQRKRETVLSNALRIAHEWVQSAVLPGDTVIDATVGNGHDTLTLAEAVGGGGRVIGFDIQFAALASAKQRLWDAGVDGQVELLEQGHETMNSVVHEKVTAVMFNLGFLPGNDTKDQVTKPETTLIALQQAVKLLKVGGIVTIVMYMGHVGGGSEASVVMDMVAGLKQTEYSVVHYRSVNQRNSPAELIGIERLGG